MGGTHFGGSGPPAAASRAAMMRRVEEIESEWQETVSILPRKSSISGETIWGSMYKKTRYTKIGVYLGDTEITNQIWKSKHIRYAHKAEERKSRVTTYATGKEIFEAKLKGEA